MKKDSIKYSTPKFRIYEIQGLKRDASDFKRSGATFKTTPELDGYVGDIIVPLYCVEIYKEPTTWFRKLFGIGKWVSSERKYFSLETAISFAGINYFSLNMGNSFTPQKIEAEVSRIGGRSKITQY